MVIFEFILFNVVIFFIVLVIPHHDPTVSDDWDLYHQYSFKTPILKSKDFLWNDV